MVDDEFGLNCNRVFRAGMAVMEVTARGLEAGLSGVLSPMLTQSTLWFLARFASSHLMPTETYYVEMAMNIVGAFGQDSSGARWTIEFLLSAVSSLVKWWSSEEKVLLDAVDLCHTLAESTDK